MVYAPSESSIIIQAEEVPAPPWWEQEYFGIPLWVWILGGVGGAVAIGAIAYEMRRQEMMMMLMAR